MDNDLAILTEEDVETAPPPPSEDVVFADDSSRLRFTKSRRLLLLYGCLSLLFGVGVICCGIASFVLLPQFQSRHSFQIEWKWTNLILVFSGSAAILLVTRETLTSICVALVASLLAISMGFCLFVVHIVNIYFRRRDTEYYKVHAVEHVESSVAVGTTNLALLMIGFLSCILSIVQFRHVLHIAGKNFGFSLHVEKHRLRLSGLGMAQIFAGLLITAWWIAIEALFQGQNIDFHALPTSEVLAHGLVIASTGYLQMLATSKACQPLLICAAILNSASLLLAVFFSARPLSLIYLVVEIGQSTMTSSFEIKFGLAAMLCLFYILEILFSIYSVIKFLHLAAGNAISRLDNLLEKSRRLFHICSTSQLLLGVIYALLEIIAVGFFFAYKLDFSPLPIFIIVCGVFGHGAVRMGSAMLLVVTVVFAGICSSFAFRDIYMFAYHAISHGPTPADKIDGVTSHPMEASSLALHFAIAVLALAEVILSIIMIVFFIRALLGSVSCSHNQSALRRSSLMLKILAIGHLLLCAVVLVLGGVIFLNRLPFLEVLGDYALTTGLLMLLASLLSVLALFTKYPVLLLPALFSQIATFTLVWQQSDEFAYLVHYYLEQAPEQIENELPALSMASIVLTAIFLYWMTCGLVLLLQGGLLERATFAKFQLNPDKVEEMVAMGTKPVTVESELNQLEE